MANEAKEGTALHDPAGIEEQTKSAKRGESRITPPTSPDEVPHAPPSPPAPEEPEEVERVPGIPEEAPDTLHEAARGKTYPKGDVQGDEAEAEVLDYLMREPKALEFNVVAKVEGPEGTGQLRFHIRQVDAAVIERLENEHTDGVGPWAKTNMTALNAALVGEATLYIEDLANGKRVDPKSAEFRGQVPSPAIALERRFAYQGAVLEAVAGEVRRIGGVGMDRVRRAERAMAVSVKT